ncbi:MAG: ribonuclease P protein component [Chitinophagales bacterium]
MLPAKQTRFTLTKKERLKSSKIISDIFDIGQTKVIYPFRIVWLETPLNSSFPVQFGISVSTRKMPTAVARNRIKRQAREAYRLHKHLLYDTLNAKKEQDQNKQVAVMFIYLSKKHLPYSFISAKLVSCLQYLCLQYEQSPKTD